MKYENLNQIRDVLLRRIRPRILIVLMLFWVLLTGEFTVGYLFIGFLFSLIIILFWGGFLLPPSPGKALFVHPTLILTIFKYIFNFIVELIDASIGVTRLVLDPRLPIEPGFVEFDLELDKTINRVLLANTITLTPGTLSVFLAREHIVVHALTRESAVDVVDWEMQEYLEEFEEV